MTIQEQITALLNGDMTDEVHVAELMHVLAVSPEKRALLVEQVAMSRAFTTMGTGIVPPASADLNILKGIAAVDAGFAVQAPAQAPSDPAPVPIPAPVATSGFSMLAPILGVLCLALGLGAGYLIWGRGGKTEVVAGNRGAASVAVASAVDRSAALRDSLGLVRSQLLALDADHRRAMEQIAGLKNRPERVRVVYRDRPVVVHQEEARHEESPIPAAAIDSTPRTVNSAELRHALPPATDAPARELATSSSAVGLPIDQEEKHADDASEGRWQVGLRDNFRLSLPRVYGLAGNRSILFDKDIVATYRMGAEEGDGLLSSFRLGLTAGETQFAQVFHTNTGGMPIDTIIEQSPTLQYLRFLLAPELVRTTQVTGSLELGAGSTMQRFRIIAPFATVGLNLEYRPVDLLSIQAGGSTWLMWTEFRNQIYVSTNLNAHLGFAVGF